MELRMRNHVAAALLAVDVRAYVRGVLGQMMVRGRTRGCQTVITLLDITGVFREEPRHFGTSPKL